MTVDDAMQYLENVARTKRTKRTKVPADIGDLCLAAISAYDKGFGGAKHHHNFEGGLAVHTAEVVQYCVAMAGEGMDLDVLLTAAYWHDYAKRFEYTRVGDAISH